VKTAKKTEGCAGQSLPRRSVMLFIFGSVRIRCRVTETYVDVVVADFGWVIGDSKVVVHPTAIE
jgi:hypothetical protein